MTPVPYQITISREMISRHQGELTILLIEPRENIAIARLPLNRTRNKLTIAGLQGPPPVHKDNIIATIRDLDRLRPKRIVLEAAMALAEWLQADQVVATAKQNHVSQRLRKWRQKIHADYDQFWQEFTENRDAEGNYLLPLSLPRANHEDLPAKKRKLRQRRDQRLDELTTDTMNALSALAKC